VTFPKRSLPWLFSNAALGGLKPAPASRLRGAHPHLLCSCAHFMKKCARGALIEMITALRKFVDSLDICNFYKRCNLPLCWIPQVLELLRNLCYTAESKTIPHFDRRYGNHNFLDLLFFTEFNAISIKILK
jgi:hypothetical protein